MDKFYDGLLAAALFCAVPPRGGPDVERLSSENGSGGAGGLGDERHLLFWRVQWTRQPPLDFTVICPDPIRQQEGNAISHYTAGRRGQTCPHRHPSVKLCIDSCIADVNLTP